MKPMKLRELLQKARRQSCYRSIRRDVYLREDKMQWVVETIMLMGPEFPALKHESRFVSYPRADRVVQQARWARIEANIAALRKKYKRPSKSKMTTPKEHKIGETFELDKIIYQVRKSYSCLGCSMLYEEENVCTRRNDTRLEHCSCQYREDDTSVIFVQVGETEE